MDNYWNIFNFFAKFIGGTFVLIGTIIFIWGIVGAITAKNNDGVLIACCGLLAVVIGLLVFFAKPSKPE